MAINPWRSVRITGKRLADLCHRLAISLEAGVDIRKVWQREAENARGPHKAAFESIRDGVARGDSLTESINDTGLFPRLFCEMTEVGEQTGGLPDVYHRLSNHYQHAHERGRKFKQRLAWPLLELSAAVVIVGLMIAVLDMVGLTTLDGDPIDILGLGFTGGQGLLAYVVLVSIAVGTLSLLYLLARSGGLFSQLLQQLAMRIPGVGDSLQKIALARIAWALHLTLNVEMDLRRLAPLVLRASGSNFYERHSKQVTQAVGSGQTLHEAFSATGAFPYHFLDAVETAEESGQIVESMGRLSKQYEQEAESAMQTLATIASFAIWGGIMLVIAFMVIRMFQVVYLDRINEALAM